MHFVGLLLLQLHNYGSLLRISRHFSNNLRLYALSWIFLFRLSSWILPDCIPLLFLFSFCVAMHGISNSECNTFCIVRQWTLSAAAIFRISLFVIIWHLQYLHESVQSCFSRRQLGSLTERTIKVSCNWHYPKSSVLIGTAVFPVQFTEMYKNFHFI